MENKWTRGSVFYADLGDVKGSEQGGVRPIVVVSNDKNNLYSKNVTVVPVTTKPKKTLCVHVAVTNTRYNGLTKPGFILCEQIRTISKERLQNRIGAVNKQVLKEIDTAMKIQLGL